MLGKNKIYHIKGDLKNETEITVNNSTYSYYVIVTKMITLHQITFLIANIIFNMSNLNVLFLVNSGVFDLSI